MCEPVVPCIIRTNYDLADKTCYTVVNVVLIKAIYMHSCVALSYIHILINTYEDVNQIFKQEAAKKTG